MKYTPGQKLNNAAEAMQALLDGQKIRISDFDDYFHLVNGEIKDRYKRIFNPDLSAPLNPWTIYTPPKRTVKSERWFAVAEGWRDSNELMWSGGFYTENEARHAYPNAHAYVKAECEVEVEG